MCVCVRVFARLSVSLCVVRMGVRVLCVTG